MPSKTTIQNGIYEIKDISKKEKFLPLMYTYIKVDKRISVLFVILLIAVLIYLQMQKINIVLFIPYIFVIIMILFFMLFALSRLLIIKNNEKQYIKISGNIVKLIDKNLNNIEAFDLSKNHVKNCIIVTGNMITIILESHRIHGNYSSIKCAVTFPKNCLYEPIVDKSIINSIKEKEDNVYRKYVIDNVDINNIDISEANAIKDIIENERQKFNRKHNIK